MASCARAASESAPESAPAAPESAPAAPAAPESAPAASESAPTLLLPGTNPMLLPGSGTPDVKSTQAKEALCTPFTAALWYASLMAAPVGTIDVHHVQSTHAREAEHPAKSFQWCAQLAQ